MYRWVACSVCLHSNKVFTHILFISVTCITCYRNFCICTTNRGLNLSMRRWCHARNSSISSVSSSSLSRSRRKMNRLSCYYDTYRLEQILNCWSWNASWLSECFSGYLLGEKGSIIYWLKEILTKGEKRYFASVGVLTVVLMKVQVQRDVVPCHWQMLSDISEGFSASIYRMDISCYSFLDC